MGLPYFNISSQGAALQTPAKLPALSEEAFTRLILETTSTRPFDKKSKAKFSGEAPKPPKKPYYDRRNWGSMYIAAALLFKNNNN